MFIALFFAIIISLIVGAVLGRASVDTKPLIIEPNLDSSRISYLEAGRLSAFYNVEHKAWAILTTDGKPSDAAFTLREAIDKARAKSNG